MPMLLPGLRRTHATRWAAFRQHGGVRALPISGSHYHNYYRAPDLVGPAMAQRFAIPYVIAEGSYARSAIATVGRGIRRWRWKACDSGSPPCFTARDLAGLAEVVPRARLLDFRRSSTLPKRRQRLREQARARCGW